MSGQSSRERHEAILGPEVMAFIARAVEEAPALSPVKFERLRRIFGPAAARYRQEHAAAEHAERTEVAAVRTAA